MAQQGQSEASQLGVSTGPLLPRRVGGVREIIPMTAIRYAFESALGYLEFEGSFGNANGNLYTISSARLVYDFDYDKYIDGLFFIGGDFHYFRKVRKIRTIFINGSTGETTETITFEPGDMTSFNGWHYGFAITTQVTQDVHFRADVIQRYSPGQILYIGLGADVSF